MFESGFDLPGWSTAIDQRTGRQYFINMIEKTTTWEDPRNDPRYKYKPIQIPMQTLHGSPKNNVQIYPTQNYPVQAFQSYPGQSVSIQASPIPSTKMSHTVEMSSLSRSSPHTPRLGNLIKNHQQMLQQQQLQETSFSNPTPIETEAVVSKINTMFPTASEHHIRLLLKKYHNREAVVISALQVEKHPLTTPGPYTPPIQRASFQSTAMALSAFTPPSSTTFGRKNVHILHGDHLTLASSSNGSPIPHRPQSSASYYTTATTTASVMFGSPSIRLAEQYRSSPKPHSPKMKLRYLKSMFPKADENIILDVLAMADNNVQKSSEQLKTMGYEKKEMTPAPRLSHRKREDQQPKKEAIEPTPPPKLKTAEEKKKLKARLQSQYKSIPEKIISMALESVDFSEEKALRILDIVVQEDKEKDSKKKTEKEKKKGETIEKNVSFRERESSGTDLEKAAAVENDETMIINSDHSIITTPVESPRTETDGSSIKLPLHAGSDETPTPDTSTSEAAEKNKRHRPKARSESNRSEKNIQVASKKEGVESKSILKTKVKEDDKGEHFLSIFKKTTVVGSQNLAKGPKDNLLLSDYVIWNGSNPEIVKGRNQLSNGPNASLRSERTYTPRGRSSELCKGPSIGLAKGSIYQIKPNVACN